VGLHQCPSERRGEEVPVKLASLALRGAGLTESPSYQSSVTVDNAGEGERGEAARYAGLAKIDVGRAMAAAQAQVPGKVLSAALENENGNLVYSVVIAPASGPVQDVKVDAGNVQVLHTETGNSRERDEEEKD
jgi:uncharacterized membrane protein YkoI